MGLSERKNKVRLVGSATTANRRWAQDSAAPGQRLLAAMGWQAGQGLGSSDHANQTAQNAITAQLKLDNKGIGVHRAEKEARASGAGLDPWSNQGARDFGALLERLNAAAAPAPGAKRSHESTSAPASETGQADERAAKRRRKEARAEEKKAAKADKTSSKKRSKEQGADTSPAPSSAAAPPQSAPARAVPAHLACVPFPIVYVVWRLAHDAD